MEEHWTMGQIRAGARGGDGKGREVGAEDQRGVGAAGFELSADVADAKRDGEEGAAGLVHSYRMRAKLPRSWTPSAWLFSG